MIGKGLVLFLGLSGVVGGASVGSLLLLSSNGVIQLGADPVRVEFHDYDDSLLYYTSVVPGDGVEYKGPLPTREPDEYFSYQFSNWDRPLDHISEACVIRAEYFTFDREYTVTFENWNHTVLYKDKVAAGGTAYYLGAVPYREPSDGYIYRFKGWDNELTHIYNDCTVTALFDEIEEEYEVSFLHEDGTVLYVDKVARGDTAVYHGLTPQKKGDGVYEYEFAGWNKSLEDVRSSFSTTALFVPSESQFEVTFCNYDEEVLYVDKVGYGGTATYVGATPTRPSEGQYGYAFTGWSKPITNITEDTIVFARYSRYEITYDVSFKNYDGSLLQLSKVRYGKSVKYLGEDPVRPDDEKYTYTFVGWDRDIDCVTENLDVYPVWEKELRTFRTIFRNEDGSLLYEGATEYGKTAVYLGETPYKASDLTTVYQFDGWDKPLENITEDTEFIAQFIPFTEGGGGGMGIAVFFYNYDGTLLDADAVDKGESATYRGDVPTRPDSGGYSYQVASNQPWSESSNYTYVYNVEETMAVYAQYDAYDKWNNRYLIVSYRHPDGTLLYEDIITPYSSSSYKGPVYDFLQPVYGFTGWVTKPMGDQPASLSYVWRSMTVFASFGGDIA